MVLIYYSKQNCISMCINKTPGYFEKYWNDYSVDIGRKGGVFPLVELWR